MEKLSIFDFDFQLDRAEWFLFCLIQQICECLGKLFTRLLVLLLIQSSLPVIVFS